MKKSWTPQLRSKIFCNPIFLSIGFIIVAFVSFILFLIFNNIECWVPVFLYAFLCVHLFLEVQRWDSKGYEKITIDTDNSIIIFDNKTRIPFNLISDIYINVEEPPPDLYSFRTNSVNVENLRKISDYNAFLIITLTTGRKIDFSVPNVAALIQIVSCLRDCGFKIPLEESEGYKFRNLYFIISGIICILIVIICIFMMVTK